MFNGKETKQRSAKDSGNEHFFTNLDLGFYLDLGHPEDLDLGNQKDIDNEDIVSLTSRELEEVEEKKDAQPIKEEGTDEKGSKNSISPPASQTHQTKHVQAHPTKEANLDKKVESAKDEENNSSDTTILKINSLSNILVDNDIKDRENKNSETAIFKINSLSNIMVHKDNKDRENKNSETAIFKSNNSSNTLMDKDKETSKQVKSDKNMVNLDEGSLLSNFEKDDGLSKEDMPPKDDLLSKEDLMSNLKQRNLLSNDTAGNIEMSRMNNSLHDEFYSEYEEGIRSTLQLIDIFDNDNKTHIPNYEDLASDEEELYFSSKSMTNASTEEASLFNTELPKDVNDYLVVPKASIWLLCLSGDSLEEPKRKKNGN